MARLTLKMREMTAAAITGEVMIILLVKVPSAISHLQDSIRLSYVPLADALTMS